MINQSTSDSKIIKKLKTLDPVVSLQEVPGEISLIFQITGCPHRCHGCHSSELWSDRGVDLTLSMFEFELAKYKGFLTCICFFGGEWLEEDLLPMLKIAKSHGYKTCLYSGAETVSEKITRELNFLKLGPWVEALGGLDSKNTNQIFYDLKNKTTLNYLFQKTY